MGDEAEEDQYKTGPQENTDNTVAYPTKETLLAALEAYTSLEVVKPRMVTRDELYGMSAEERWAYDDEMRVTREKAVALLRDSRTTKLDLLVSMQKLKESGTIGDKGWREMVCRIVRVSQGYAVAELDGCGSSAAEKAGFAAVIAADEE